jgi:serine/threonine protein phosphatase PrpC
MTDPRAGARSDPGRVRENNEDRWLVRDERGVMLMAVADGVGGVAGGEHASADAVDALSRRFFEAVRSQDLHASLATAMREANDAVVRSSSERGDGAATTLVAAAVRKREATVANLGDSRAYLVRDGTGRQLTTDHSGTRPNEITRFVGDARGVQPDVFVETLRSGDRLVLCSDGLTRHVSDEEIALRAARDEPYHAASALIDLANERGGEDNITVVIYRVRSPMHPIRGRRVPLALLLLLAAITLAAVAWATSLRAI